MSPDRLELFADRLEMVQAFLETEVVEIVGAQFVAQECGELLVLRLMFREVAQGESEGLLTAGLAASFATAGCAVAGNCNTVARWPSHTARGVRERSSSHQWIAQCHGRRTYRFFSVSLPVLPRTAFAATAGLDVLAGSAERAAAALVRRTPG
jgi:hypothetical protein